MNQYTQTRRTMSGMIGDLQEPEFPLVAAMCPLETAQVMEAVAQAAAGGTTTVIVSIRMERDTDGRDTYHDVPVAVIVPPADFRRLRIKEGDEDSDGPRLLPTPSQTLDYAERMIEPIRQIRARGGEVIVMEVVAGGIDIFQDVEVRRVDRQPGDQPKVPKGWIKDPAPELAGADFGLPVDSGRLIYSMDNVRDWLEGADETVKPRAVRLLIARCLEWFQFREIPDAEGK